MVCWYYAYQHIHYFLKEPGGVPSETRWVIEERLVDSLLDKFGARSDQFSARVGRVLC